MTEFLATLQVAYPAPSVSTGLKALCFVLVGFQPTISPPHKPPMIATSPSSRDKDPGNDDSPCVKNMIVLESTFHELLTTDATIKTRAIHHKREVQQEERTESFGPPNLTSSNMTR